MRSSSYRLEVLLELGNPLVYLAEEAFVLGGPLRGRHPPSIVLFPACDKLRIGEPWHKRVWSAWPRSSASGGSPRTRQSSVARTRGCARCSRPVSVRSSIHSSASAATSAARTSCEPHSRIT